MPRPLRVLIAEDNPADAELTVRELRRAGFDPEWNRVDTEQAYLAGLLPAVDIILSDYEMPQFSGLRALELLNHSGLEIPFIVISGTIGEETAVAAMQRGAADYLLKDRLARLGQAINNALEQSQLRRERRQAEQALRENAAFVEDVLNSLTAEVVVVDESGEITAANEAWKRFAQENSGADYIGHNYLTACARSVQRFGDSDALAASEGIRSVLDGSTKEFTMEYPCPSPVAQRWFQMRATPLSGGHKAAVVSHEDITERKLAEERISEQAAMLDRARDAIIVRDFHTRKISFWNRGAEILYGWTVEEATGRDIGELICVDPAASDEICDALLKNDEWRGETRHKKKDGTILVMSIGATLVRDAAGLPKSVLSIAADITEQKNLEARFLRAQRMESIGTLASGVAHDLNNILAPIMMSVPVLRRDLRPEQREDIIATIEMSAERGAQIIKQVLTFGRGLEGKRSPLKAGALINEMMKIMRGTFPKNLTLECSIEPDLWPVIGDSTQLHQVLLNLCVNARDAMPDGGRLRLVARNLDLDSSYASMIPEAKPGPHVLLEVSDSGTGIPPEIVERIYDPFFTTKGMGKGTGLGLSTVLGIVKSHDGFIHVNTQPGKGTTFQVYLPASQENDAPPADTSREQVPEGHGELILVVDDEASVRAAVRISLESAGYRVLLAADGTEALAMFALNSESVAVVLTDIMMPYMDGVALIRALRTMMPALPIIASTGLGEKVQLADLKTLNVGTVLNKPYGADTLLRTIHQTLHLEDGLK